MAHVCIIHPYPSRYLIDCFARAGHTVVLVTSNTNDHAMPGAEIHRAALFDESEVRRIVETCHCQRPFDVILPVYEGSTGATARLSASLGLPGNSADAAESSRNKYEAYSKWSAAGVPAPKTVPIPELAALPANIELLERELGYPFVLKLADSMNSQGVSLVRSRAELDRRVEPLSRLLERPVDFDPRDDRNRLAYGRGAVKLIAQEFCDGPEVGIDLLYGGGRWVMTGLFEKAPAHGPYFAESMSISPSSLGEAAEKELGEVAYRAVTALGATRGAAHVEIRYGAGGPRVLEAGLRPGGGYTMQSVEQLYGLNVPAELVRILLGGAPPVVPEVEGAALYGGIVYPKSGVLERASGMEVFENMAGLKSVVVLHQPGDRVYALPESAQPHFTYYLLIGRDRDEVLSKHRRIQSEVELTITPF